MSTLIERLQQSLGGAYRVERELPLGGLGRLFLAEQAASFRQVVVQVLPPDVAGRTDAARFTQAIARAARLRHSAILPVIEAGAGGGLLWCIADHATGESLRFRLLREGAVGAEEARQILRDVADALAAAHARGVCHGDLKPDNIYLRNGRAIIADFGVRWALFAAGGGEDGGSPPTPEADVAALVTVAQGMLSGGSASAPIAAAAACTNAAAFRDALGETAAMRRRKRTLVQGGVLVAAVLLAGAVGGHEWRERARLDPDLVVVAPFEILTPEAEHALWREGLVDILAANLDGAGPLHTVSPSAAIRGWNGRYDADAAVALGRRTGARLAIYGRVVHEGGDTMRLSARLLDAASGDVIAELQFSDPAARLDRLADSLTVGVLRELARSRPIGAVRTASLGSGSLPALKAFLIGEQHYRRTEWDSALASYEHAIALDSGFALAYYRAGIVIGWIRASGDSLSTRYLLRAAAMNHGLPPRDSMLLVAESLGAAVDAGIGPDYWRSYRRLYQTVNDATQRYPDDPETWYEAGEVRFHYPFFATIRGTRETFDRAIALDSTFAPAYIHPIELALMEGRPADARRYIDGYLRLQSHDIYADGVRLSRLLLDPRTARSAAVTRTLDTASVQLLSSAEQQFSGWADSLDTDVLLTQLMVSVPHAAEEADTADLRAQLVSALAYSGHLTEALASAGGKPAWLVACAAMLGGVPDDSTALEVRRSLREDRLWPRSAAVMAAPWLATRRDTSALRELARRADSLARAGEGFLRPYGRYVAEGARAFLRLAQGDTADALAELTALPDTACERCVTYRVARGLLGALPGGEAAEVLREDPPGRYYPTDGLWMLARARAAERVGDRAAAVRAYRFVRDVWAHADPALQRDVEEAKAGLLRLGAT